MALFGAAAPVRMKRSDFNYGLWTKDETQSELLSFIKIKYELKEVGL